LALADIAPGQVCALYEETRERFYGFARQVEGPAVWLAGSLTAEQFKHIEAKFAKVNSDYQREWGRLNSEERLERRLKVNIERAEEFYGRLEDAQVNALKGVLAASLYNPTLNAAERQRRQQDLMRTLRSLSSSGGGQKPSDAQALAQLRAYRDRVEHSPNPAYEVYSQKVMQESCASFSALHNSTTKEQRERAVRRLAAYERDAQELSAQR
jgi:hypothetical protein